MTSVSSTYSVTFPSGNGYTCYLCGGWVSYGTTHTCCTVPASYSWFTTPCDHCLCISVPRSKLKSHGHGVSSQKRTKPHKECCHCGRAYADATR